MTAHWIDKLNESDSRLHKEDVLTQALELAMLGEFNSQLFLSLTKACYDPYVTFGVKQVPETKNLINRENPWADFNGLLQRLHERLLTGNAAKSAIQEMSLRFDSDNWNKFCAPVIRKDLRAGISDKTINKVCGNTEYQVPIFGCQLATNCEGRPEMRGIKRIEPKLDGVRVLMMVIPGDEIVSVVSYSRNGKIFENFTHIEQEVLNSVSAILKLSKHKNALINGFVLDGEVVGKSFQDLMRQARRKENAQADDSVYHVFDIIPLADFNAGFWNARLRMRLNILNDMKNIISRMSTVALVPSIEVNLDYAEGNDQLDRYAKDCVNSGYEGVMIKDIEAPYECKRNTFWLKWKPTITVDLEVIDVEEGTGKNKGRLGALVCQGIDSGRQITVNVGSGFSDADRDDYWANRDLVIGRYAEILCDVITRNMDGTYSLRFPRFVRFRDDK